MVDQVRSRLVMNPFVDVHVWPQPDAYPIDPSRIETITLRCPVRGRGLLVHTLSRTGDPELFRFFLTLVERDGGLDLESDSPLVPALVRIGFFVIEKEVVDWPQFEVRLDVEPSEAADGPTGFDPIWQVIDTFLFQPKFKLHPKVGWPAEYDQQEGLLRCFGSGPAFWLGEPADFVTPFWVTSEEAAILAHLVPGERPPPLPPPLARALVSVGAIARRDRVAPAPLASFEGARTAFAADRYAILRAPLPAAELTALRRYYASLLTAGLVPLGDRQHSGRFSLYNDPVGRFMHARLACAMAAIAGQPVRPSFSYFFSYVEAGADLPPHKDRPQAEFSISLQLDYHPKPAQKTGWPLCFSFDDRESASADLRIGDAVFYHGRELTHYRAALPAGHQSSHLVLEYVPRDFRGLLI